MRLYAILLSASLLTALMLQAQHDPYTAPVWRGPRKPLTENDSSSLLAAFRSGSLHGHFRNFFMATTNRGELSDYYANGLGGGIRYETGSFRNFQMAISGYFIFNTFSSDLGHADPLTKARNRYEIGLFDIEDPENRNDIDRLEELYLRYARNGTQLTAGKQIIKTPFINPQDGRMRPTEVEGIYGQVEAGKKWTVQGGWLYKISPRSTVRWFSVGESIGVYPTGVNPDGSKSGYAGHIRSGGVGLLGVTYAPNKNLSIKFWEQFTENVFNTALVQADLVKPAGRGNLIAGLQLVRQDPVANGGNDDVSKAYFTPGTRTNIVSTRLGWKQDLWNTSINYTRIGKGGRFLSPREWGRDPFYTFMQRERNEGLGDVHAVMLRTSREVPQARLRLDAGIGYFDLPDVKDFRHNKYGLPSYAQYLLEAKYDFNGLLKGLDVDFLYVYKQRVGDTYGNPAYVINKVDMSNFNIVLNYHF